MLPARDAELVQIVDIALADATRRSLRPDGTSWLSCRPGCTPCCHGVFRISALDAARLHAGLHQLRLADPERAQALQQRARALVKILTPHFPGDALTGVLAPANADDEHWDQFADLPAADAACPALDPATGRCDLYAARPLTCRVFGPPVLNEGGLGMCELCYIGAPASDILRGELFLEHHVLEEQLTAQVTTQPGHTGPLASQDETVIAWALLL